MEDLSNEWIPVATINNRIVAKYPDGIFKFSFDGKHWINASKEEIKIFNWIEEISKHEY